LGCAVPYVHIVVLDSQADPWYSRGMSEFIRQLSFSSDDSEETKFVRRMKEVLAAHPDPRGDKLVATFKVSRDRHGELMAAVDKHGMTITDVLTFLIDQVTPMLQRAKPVEVRGYTLDKRTKAAIRLKEMRRRERYVERGGDRQ